MYADGGLCFQGVFTTFLNILLVSKWQVQF